MKYTNEQRIEKLQKYIDDNEITRKDVAENETVRWTFPGFSGFLWFF